jgi:aspartate kinase
MLSVLKIGGSVLRTDDDYRIVANELARRLARHSDERLVVIVSARHGVTDALLARARSISTRPEGASLDLLWSTGETASVAELALHLSALGVAAVPLNVHQAGLQVGADAAGPGVAAVRPLRVLAALADAPIVVVPGFLGVRPGGAIQSLGRGGSDLTAVLLAVALGADACELVKDVPGYFTSDPHADASAVQIREISIDRAIEMADAGCDLVQAAALRAARMNGLRLIVRCLDGEAPATHVQPRSAHGIRHQDHSRRAAVGA